MRPKPILPATFAWFVAACTFLGAGGLCAYGAGIKLEAQLIWGTNEDHSPESKHKPVESDVRNKLKELPLKWTHYFMVNRQALDVAPAGISKVPLSDKCQLEVKSLGGTKLEVSLFGKGKEVVKRTQSLPIGEILVLGGNAPNDTAWLVVLKRVE